MNSAKVWNYGLATGAIAASISVGIVYHSLTKPITLPDAAASIAQPFQQPSQFQDAKLDGCLEGTISPIPLGVWKEQDIGSITVDFNAALSEKPVYLEGPWETQCVTSTLEFYDPVIPPDNFHP